MGRRHSQNSTAKSYFTSAEKKKAGYGTQTARIGTDSKLPFGHCCLGLQPAVEPLISPSGHIYSKEAIYSYLLVRQEELRKARKAWKRAREAAALEAAESVSRAEAAATERLVADSERVSRKRKATDLETTHRRFVLAPHVPGKLIADPRSKGEKQKELKTSSHWLPEFTPAAPKRQKTEKPPKRPLSPISGRPLRLKDLTPIKFTTIGGRAGGGDVKVVCDVSQKQITYQDVVFIKTTGAVMLAQCYKDFAKATMKCPKTGKGFAEADVITIKNDGTGFAASGNVVAKKYNTPLMN